VGDELRALQNSLCPQFGRAKARSIIRSSFYGSNKVLLIICRCSDAEVFIRVQLGNVK
jgi:hypothetical protein